MVIQGRTSWGCDVPSFPATFESLLSSSVMRCTSFKESFKTLPKDCDDPTVLAIEKQLATAVGNSSRCLQYAGMDHFRRRFLSVRVCLANPSRLGFFVTTKVI
ncbi:hypothetical protein AVEN_251761-1 [Araneus ventricosus]|uniref:Uncharacterized protein n=1 Tax=Araneus ventricosus TaxID=182803 RepID=A0A4Y2MEQ1_ARAVE|nr:hypothetical protein AVEN_251761-1 [Araneus ventricosus]